jgi:dTDP-4-amino-4,6-dideoxygalactose transaminase
VKLALHGGSPVRTAPFPGYVTVGAEEKEAARRVIDSGILSRYLGVHHEQFMGGPEVRALEKEWTAQYGCKQAIAVNSASSGLICALGAAGVGPGDEVIVTPWSMSISATAPLFYGAIPVFADIERDYFCLDPVAVAKKITPRTKAIIAVDLFGLPYDAQAVNSLAEKQGITVIEDAAQAPGALFRGKSTGTLGHMGVHSLNYHKHIHCGEGGVVCTDDETLAQRLCLIRNHAEEVVAGLGVDDLTNMVGYNMRMTELDAAVARCQLPKLARLNRKRLVNVAFLEKKLEGLPCFTMPQVRSGASHVYYVHALRFDEHCAGVSVKRFAEALKAELPSFALREKEGTKLGHYVKPLYLRPIFQKRLAIGREGWPFTLAPEQSYAPGICPVCEHLHEHEILTHEFILPSMEEKDLTDVADAFFKVWERRKFL